jgi:heme A synthase
MSLYQMSQEQVQAFKNATDGATPFEFGSPLHLMVGVFVLIFAILVLLAVWRKKNNPDGDLSLDTALMVSVGVLGLIAVVAILLYIPH